LRKVDSPAFGAVGEPGGRGSEAVADRRMAQVSWKNAGLARTQVNAMTPTGHPAAVLAPPRLPDGSELVMRVMPLPADTNPNGDIFGGWLMAQMDLGASVLSRRRARGRVATVAVDGMEFHKPVKVGDVLAIHSVLEREGRTSMKISVEAWITRMPERLSWSLALISPSRARTLR